MLKRKLSAKALAPVKMKIKKSDVTEIMNLSLGIASAKLSKIYEDR